MRDKVLIQIQELGAQFRKVPPRVRDTLMLIQLAFRHLQIALGTAVNQRPGGLEKHRPWHRCLSTSLDHTLRLGPVPLLISVRVFRQPYSL